MNNVVYLYVSLQGARSLVVCACAVFVDCSVD